jgi:hypothetical protein
MEQEEGRSGEDLEKTERKLPEVDTKAVSRGENESISGWVMWLILGVTYEVRELKLINWFKYIENKCAR